MKSLGKSRLFVLISTLIVSAFMLMGASCNDSGSVVPQIPPETDVKIYETFFQVEAKYNATYDLVVEFSKLVAQTTNLGCSAGVPQICDAGKKYKAFYDAQLVPASQRATDAYNGALNVWQDYRKGTATEADLQQRIDALRKLIDDLNSLFGQGQEIVHG